MQRYRSLLAAALALAIALPATAQNTVAGITGQLRGLGFQQIDVGQTLLGRTRIVAISAEGQREIVVNPRTGEILRDLWRAAPGKSATHRLVDTRGRQGGEHNAGQPRSDDAGSDGTAADRPDHDENGQDDASDPSGPDNDRGDGNTDDDGGDDAGDNDAGKTADD